VREFEIENSAGTQVGRIVDPARLAAETARGESESKWSRLKGRLNLTNQPSEHLLLIRGYADLDLRLMMRPPRQPSTSSCRRRSLQTDPSVTEGGPRFRRRRTIDAYKVSSAHVCRSFA
jgi:hypothetical protein